MQMTLGPTSHVYFSQGLKLHYVDWGNHSGPPLLLIHGGRDHCRNWDWVAERLREHYHIIAPDLRGHGDSAWSNGSSYSTVNYVYDIAQLVLQKKMMPVTIISHSLGGALALLYAGIYPDTVKKLVAIEGMGAASSSIARDAELPIEERFRYWIDTRRQNAGRVPRKYATIEDAVARMREENKRLSAEQAWHLTIHGTYQNEDGSFSWKFDNQSRFVRGPGGLSDADQHRLWSQITCPVLLVRGVESWASDPAVDGGASHFRNARSINIEKAGHWVHHDRLDEFMTTVSSFLRDS